MAKVVKFPTKAERLPAGVDSVIDRFREIAKASADHLVLADGEPSPDMDLLDECAEALHLIRRRDQRLKEWREEQERRSQQEGWGFLSQAGLERRKAEIHRELDEENALTHRAKVVMRRVRKMRATTGAGIYAKALLVRGSHTGAACLAMSLAEDLIALPSLRATLWPADAEAAE